jgi:hypothetical protein
MIEPRKHPHMEFVLRLALHFLGPGWGLQLFVGPQNLEFARDMVAGWGAVRLHDIGRTDLSVIEYNTLKKQASLWQEIAAEHVLWLEPDCIVCRPGIERYIHHDYIGAPWRSEFALSPTCRVGNGGLSLRRRSAMLRIATQANPSHDAILTEDVYFVANMLMCNRHTPGSFNIAQYEVAREFAVEGVYHPAPLGLHKAWRYLDGDQVGALLDTVQL